ncbi:hypothetical protein [Entomospira culicis]|uniref:Uncharacterized protein n=1 Tax=Entomospira culicis TaxID=2719989 RepID=A0A968KW80_9SPIO|nr:hypothetical protein [Entomospira culicis]NIZ18687.1 hypothetical protein [Entomospira culicis]NIZ68902.1 hypothetical protein [Entomospira culicis]WDI37495.1 hypothetical protein PVA46_01520 [Entomospira culicis]WDI39123.1 hypothetical protein PVA47_01525 [Entomospira culicis]
MTKMDEMMHELEKVQGIDWVAIFKKRYKINKTEVLAGAFLWYVWADEPEGIDFDADIAFDKNVVLFDKIFTQKMAVVDAIASLELNKAVESEHNLFKLYTHYLANEEHFEALHQYVIDWEKAESFPDQQWYYCYAAVRHHLVKDKSFPKIKGSLHDISDEVTNYLMGESDMNTWMNKKEQDFTGDLSECLTNLFYEEYELPRSITDDESDKFWHRFHARIYAAHDLAQFNRRYKDIACFALAQELNIAVDPEDLYGSAYWIILEQEPLKHAEICQHFYTTMDRVANPQAYAHFLLRHGYHEHL